MRTAASGAEEVTAVGLACVRCRGDYSRQRGTERGRAMKMKMRMDLDWVRSIAESAVPSGSGVARRAKRLAIGTVLKGYDCLDPKVASHLLAAQREVLAAGAAFFAEESAHAAKAADKYARRASGE